jgi:hypothetical protein
MANSKISALTSATTPLAGTEILPIVQSGVTTNVTVANLTAGRSVTTGGLTSDNFTLQTDVSGLMTLGRFGASYPWVLVRPNSTATGIEIRDFVGNAQLQITQATGNVTFSIGNLVQGTAAKGINFTANTPLAGMTSQLLNWYEEGTWTPNQGAGLTLVGAFTSAGKYTRIGRNVTVSGTVTGATSVAVSVSGVITSNLPFTVGTAGHGNATNAAITASATVICTSTSVTSASAIAATGTITFSATYFV